MQATIVYWSKTGNTRKVAETIQATLQAAGADVRLAEVDDVPNLDWFATDLLCVGFPSYQWSPPPAIEQWLKARFGAYRQAGEVRYGAPPRPGHYGLVFCTYSGPHTGEREAWPAALRAGQYLEHVGLPVLDEICVVGEFHNNEAASTTGRLGDTHGRPNQQDLAEVAERVRRVVARMVIEGAARS